MNKIQPVDLLYSAYGNARVQSDEMQMQRIKGEIYLQARIIAHHYWGGEDKRNFSSVKERAVHEQNWLNLPIIIDRCLNSYNPKRMSNKDPKKATKFSSYLISAVKHQSANSLRYASMKMRQGQLMERSLSGNMDAEEPYVQEAVEFNELTEQIKEKLKQLESGNPLFFRNIKLYIEHYVYNKQYKVMAAEREEHCTWQNIQDCITKFSRHLKEALQPLYDDYVFDNGKMNGSKEKMFASILERILVELNDRYAMINDSYVAMIEEGRAAENRTVAFAGK